MKGGFKSKRIFCNQYIKRKSRFCYAKGYPTDSFDDQGRQVMKMAPKKKSAKVKPESKFVAPKKKVPMKGSKY